MRTQSHEAAVALIKAALGDEVGEKLVAVLEAGGFAIYRQRIVRKDGDAPAR